MVENKLDFLLVKKLIIYWLKIILHHYTLDMASSKAAVEGYFTVSEKW